MVTAALARLYAGRWVEAPLQWLLWSDRDLVRAARLTVDRPVVGAEVSYGDGARLPGGLLYELWGLVVAAGGGPEAVYRLQTALELVALVLIAALVARRTDVFAGAVAAAVAATSMPWTSTSAALWNPALVPLFATLALVGADRAVRDRQPAAIGAIALAGALGAQAHLTVGVVALVLLVVVALLRPRVALRGAPLAGLLLLGAALPYLWVDGARGWPNTRALVGGSRGAPGDGDLLAAAAWLRPDVDFATGLAAHGAWLGLGAAVAVGAVVVGLARRDREAAEALLPPLAVVLVTVVGLARSDTGAAALRYALAAAPAWGVLAGEGWGRLRARVGAKAPLATALVVAPVSALAFTVVQAEDLALDHRVDEPARWSNLVGALEAVQARTGGSLVGVVGRTALWERVGGVWNHEARRGVDWLLLQAGEVFPGSRPSPCALVLFGGRDEVVDDAWLAAELSPTLGAPRLLAAEPLGERGQLVRYALDGGLCPTSLVQRYVETPAERDVHAGWRRSPEGGVVEVIGRPERHVGRLVADELPPIGVAVDLVADHGVIEATLHANQLRGRAYNIGLLEDAFVLRPRLLFEQGDEARALPFAPGLVGDGAALTPLSAVGRLPPGTWTVTLVADVLAERPKPRAPLPPTRTASLRVLDALVVPEGRP